MAKQFKPETLCVQAGWTPKKGEPRVLPIYQSTTFKYETSEQMARLFDLEESKRQSERADARKNMVGSGARSEKIRTYNFPQDRVTDHRINLSLHNLPSFMMGNMDEMLDALNVYAKEEQLKDSSDLVN